MTHLNVIAINKRKWWVTSSLATAVLASMILAGTTAQAATTTPTTAATTGQTVATQSELQDDQVTLGSQPATTTDETTTDATTTTNEDTTNPPATPTDPTPTEQAGEPTKGPDTTNDAAEGTTDDSLAGQEEGTADPVIPGDAETAEVDKPAADEPAATPKAPATKSETISEPVTQFPTKAPVANRVRTFSLAAATVPTPVTVSPDEISADEDLSTRFEDANLLAAVRKTLGLNDGDAIYLDMIKNYSVGSFTVDTSTIFSLKGLEILAYLPKVLESGTTVSGVQLTAQLGNNQADIEQMDFSPLANLKIFTLSLHTDYWGAVSDEQLRYFLQPDYSRTRSFDLSAVNNMKVHFDGLTNHQFAILSPVIQMIFESTASGNWSQAVTLSGNSVTDFSPLKNLKSTLTPLVTSTFQFYRSPSKIAYHPGETLEVFSPITGLQGESFNYQVRYQDNDTRELKLADSQQVTVIEDGQAKKVWKYTLVNPLITNGEIRYGQFYYDDAGRTTYTENGVGQPMGKTDLFTGTLFYQPIGEATSTATETYVDDTTGETLATETLTGVVGTTSDYRTATTISGYTNQGYVLKGDDYPAAGVQFTTAPQAFTVRLGHGTQALTDTKQVTQTIHYVYADGTTAAPDQVAALTFTRTGSQDLVTGTTTWAAWQSANGQTGFTAQPSPTIAGYTADQLVVPAVDGITAESANLATTVTYTAQKLQNVTVAYVDDTTGQTLHTESLQGTFGTTSEYRTAAAIQAYLKQGYVLVSDDYPTDGVTFTVNAQTFTVHLTHGTQTISNSKRVTQTIHYVYADGAPAAPDYTAWLTFTRTGTRDQVTGTEVWGAWQNIDGRGGFAAKSSPVIAGYTADQPTVAAVTNVTATSADLTTTVTYTVKGTVVPVLPEKPELEDDVLEPGPTEGGLAATALADSQQAAQRLDNLAAQGTSNAGGQPTTLTGTSGTAKTTTGEAKAADTPATQLPQTNDRTTAWSWLGALGLSLLGWVGLRRRH